MVTFICEERDDCEEG